MRTTPPTSPTLASPKLANLTFNQNGTSEMPNNLTPTSNYAPPSSQLLSNPAVSNGNNVRSPSPTTSHLMPAGHVPASFYLNSPYAPSRPNGTSKAKSPSGLCTFLYCKLPFCIYLQLCSTSAQENGKSSTKAPHRPPYSSKADFRSTAQNYFASEI